MVAAHDDVIGRLVVTFDIGLAVDDADDADEEESVLWDDCITLALLLVGGRELPSEFGECGPDEMGLFFHG